MKKPTMILFDYGQTIGKERNYDPIAGTRALLQYATKNKYGRTAEELQAVADQVNREIGRYDPATRHLFQIEVPNHMFSSYLYRSQGIELSLSAADRDRIYVNAVVDVEPAEGIGEFLAYLKEQGIRTAVLSNMTYCGEVLTERIDRLVPNHSFEFIISTAEYLYRKPNKRAFDLALEMADLPPEEVWYVGDNYKADVEGARGAGIFPVHYLGATESPQIHEDVLTAESWEALKQYMEENCV